MTRGMETHTVPASIVGAPFSASFHSEALKNEYSADVDGVGVHSTGAQIISMHGEERDRWMAAASRCRKGYKSSVRAYPIRLTT